MPKFLDASEIYDLLNRELPPEAYPEGPATGSYSGASLGAKAAVLGDAYANQKRIYENYFPQTADERLTDFEELYLGQQLDSSLTLQQRRDRVITKVRTRRRTTPADMKLTVYTVIDSSIPVDIVEWGCHMGGWVLDESQLDIETILNGYSGVQFGFQTDWCSVTAAELGLTEEQYLEYREEAYTYEVRVYGYTLTPAEREAIDKALLVAEPARSRYFIFDNLDPNDQIEGGF